MTILDTEPPFSKETAMMTYKWPTREEWAYRQQHPYWDSETGCPFANKYSHRLSDYATAEEIAELTAALKDLYRELGRELRAAKPRVEPFRQRRGEGHAAWYQRYRQLSPEDQEALQAAERLQEERTQINGLLAKIRDDAIPNGTRRGSLFGRAEKLVAPFVERYDVAFRNAYGQWEQECLQIPIDDAAWEQELEQRARTDAYLDNFGRPS